MSKAPLLFVPLPRNPCFVAREGDLEALDEQLQHCRVVVVSAPGGVGKTALALEYVYRFSSRYPCAFWLNASSRESLLADYHELSHYLRLPLQAEQTRMQESLEAVDLQTAQHRSNGQQEESGTQNQRPTLTLPDWLARVRQYLFILDDLQNPELLREIFPASLAGSMLVTTRVPDLATVSPSASFKLARLDGQDSALLLRNFSGQARDQAVLASCVALNNLACDLSGQPLALMLAGTHIKTSGVSYERFLQDYRASLAEIPAFQEHPNGFSREFAALVSLLYSSVQQSRPHAGTALDICAFLAPIAIPTLLLTSIDTGVGPQQSEIDFLLASGLLTGHRSQQAIILHPLLQQAIQAVLPLEQQRRVVVQTLHLLFQLGSSSAHNPAWNLRILAHIHHCATLSAPWSFALAEIARALAWAAAALEAHDSLNAALFLRNKALAIWERVPATKAAALLALRQKQIRLAQRLENYAEAESLLHQSIATCVSRYGVEHLLTVLHLVNLARVYLARQRNEEAEVSYKKALALCRRGREESDQFVAAIQYELALFYVRTNDFASAEFLLQGVYTACKQQLGAIHTTTLKHALELAVACMMTHKWSEAEVLLHQVCSAYENEPATPFAMVLRARHVLAIALVAQARWDAATTAYQHILDRIVATKGRLHPDLLPYLTELSYLYQVQKDRQAEKQATLDWSLEIREAQLAHSHNTSPQETLDNLNALGALYLGQQRFVEAERLFLRALLLSEQWQARDPRLLAVTLSALSLIQLAQGQTRTRQATLYMQAALTTWRSVLGPDHPDVVTLNNQYVQWARPHPGEL